jgi:hypothetical protein
MHKILKRCSYLASTAQEPPARVRPLECHILVARQVMVAALRPNMNTGVIRVIHGLWDLNHKIKCNQFEYNRVNQLIPKFYQTLTLAQHVPETLGSDRPHVRTQRADCLGCCSHRRSTTAWRRRRSCGGGRATAADGRRGEKNRMTQRTGRPGRFDLSPLPRQLDYGPHLSV